MTVIGPLMLKSKKVKSETNDTIQIKIENNL